MQICEECGATQGEHVERHWKGCSKMTYPTYEEWLPGWLARQKARRTRMKQLIAVGKLRKLLSTPLGGE